MGDWNGKVNFFNLDQSYVPQESLREMAPYNWISLEDIPETNLYCSPDAWAELRQRILQRQLGGITFIGSGNYHYLSYLLLLQIQRPFTLILFDHHTDMKMARSSLITCGSWVINAISRLQYLKQVLIIGVGKERLSTIDPLLLNRVELLPSSHWSSTELIEQLQQLPTKDVYISIDKDVLDTTDACTNWDQGSMSLDLLIEALVAISGEKQVLGVDICGEYPTTPADQFSQDSRYAIATNEEANRAILQTVLKEMRKRPASKQ